MSLNSCSIRESSYYQFRLESTTTFIKDHNNSTQYGYLNIFMTNILKLLTIDDLQSIIRTYTFFKAHQLINRTVGEI